MDIRDEIRLSKGDKLPKSSSLPDSDQNQSLNKPKSSFGVKGIGRVSPMKSKVTGKGDSPRSRWVPRSERDKVFNPQPVSQFNLVAGQVVLSNVNVNESDKAPVVAVGADKLFDLVKDKANVVKDKVKDTAVDAVNDKALDVVKEKRKTELLKDKPKDKAPRVIKNVIVKSTVVKEIDKASVVKESDKVPVVKESDKASVVAPVLKENPADVIEKSTIVNKKEKPVVDVMSKVAKDKENPSIDVTRKVPTELPKKKHKADIPKDKPKPKDKHKVDSEVPILRSKPEVKAKASISEDVKRKRILSDLDSDEVDFDSSADEVSDQKPKKMKIKADLKRKRKGGSDSDSSSIDEEKVRRLLKRLKKVKKENLDEESDLKSKKKGFSAFYNVAINKIPSRLGRYAVENFNAATYRMSFDIGDIASKLVFAHEVDFLFKVNFLTLFTNTMGRVSGLRGQICLDVVRRLLYLDSTKFDMFPVVRTRPSIRDWTSTLMRRRQDLETKEHVIGCLELHDEWTESELQEIKGFTRVSLLETSKREDLFKKAEEKLATIFSKRVFLEDLMRKASSVYPGYVKFVELQEKFIQVFRDPISFDVDVSSVDGENHSDGDDDNDQGNIDEDLNDKEPLSSNPSFSFSKVSLDDFDKQPSGMGKSPKNQVVEKESVNPTVQETVVEEIPAEEYEMLSTPETYTQWLERNADLVGEMIDSITAEYLHGDLFGQNLVTTEVLNQGPLTPDRMSTRAFEVSPSPKKRIVKLSSYLLSPYMNKKTKVVPKITRLKFIVRNSLFAMQGDKIFRDAKLKARHFFPTGCITKSMFDGTLTSNEDKWERFSNQVKAQFKGNEGGLGLEGIDLVFFPICNHGHFYVVVFRLTKTASMTILDNSRATYASKYKEVCDLLKKMFARHLKLYGHNKHAQVARLKHKVPKLKWSTKGNFHDCGIFTMLHMESYNGETASNWDCGLPIESQLQCDMLRRLRFKFATKILLHKVNVHAKKMLDLATEFDKVDPYQRMSIIMEAVKKREEHDRI
ncbi:ulp1 protease family, C-terminal catalytic domain-containing protein [Tanacetum coccineum]